MNAKAFTLVELFLVVLIVSMVSVLGSPLFSRSHELRQLRRAADEVAYMLRYARVRAMTEQVLFKVNFSERDFVLMRADNFSVSSDGTHFSNVEGIPGRVRVLPSKVSFYGQPRDVFCYPDGRIDPVHFFVRSEHGGYIISTREYAGYVAIREEDKTE